MGSKYQDLVVEKPWGFEYLAYENEDVALWALHITYENEPSLHCHPNKDTGLIVLDGSVNVSFLNDIYRLTPGRKIMIRKGLFHSTKAISQKGAMIFEIETPVNKHDIVRLEDKYGRAAKPYEGSSFEKPKPKDCVWFEEPDLGKKIEYEYANSKIVIEHIANYKGLINKEDHENIIFLKGGLMCDANKVASPGDVVASHIIKRLVNTFKEVHKDTLIMTIHPLI